MDDLSRLTDTELIALCLKRSGKDERPFAEIFQRYHSFVARVLFRYFQHEQDVEDLTQEVFFKAYRSLQNFEGRSSLKTWLFSIATNTAKNEIRSRARRPAVIDTSLHEISEQILPQVEPQHIQDALHHQEILEAFSHLNEKEQEILLLKDAHDLTYEEIASQLNISVSATKMRVQRARLAIKNMIQEFEHGH